MSISDDKTSENGKAADDAAAPVGRGKPAKEALSSRPLDAQPEEAAVPPAKPIESSLLGSGTGAAVRKTSVPETSVRPDARIEKPIPEAKPAPAEPAAKAPVVVKKTGFWPVFLGGIVAAGLGAGGAYYAIPHLPAAWQPVPPQPVEATPEIDLAALKGELAAEIDSRTAAVQAAVQTEIPAQIQSALAAQQETLEKSVQDAARAALAELPAGTSSTGDAAALTALQAAVAEVQSRLDAQAQHLQQVATQSVSDPALSAQVEQMAQHAAQLQDQVQAAAAAAEQKLADAQAQAANLQAETQNATRKAQAVGALALMQSAIDSGAPRDRALADLQAAGVEVPAALSAEVPTLQILRDGFATAARAGLRESLKAEAGTQDALGVIGNFLKVQTGARSIEPREGADPDAVLSRANASVEAGNIAGALTEVATLPDTGRQAMAGWVAQAQAYVDAQQAMADLTATIN